jgi:chemotaxis regulatin CheY-phosphate phosphatase CheZ
MDSSKNLDEVFSKIEEMRGFFKFGDEIIPFLGDMFKFLLDIMPLMTEVNTSLEDSTHKIPTASERITSVNQATEMATHEILNKLDSISNKITDISEDSTDDKSNVFEEIQDEVMDIIFALQFQDITSQKLEHANRILSAIHDKFVQLFMAIEQVKMNTKVGLKIMDVISNEVDQEKIKRDSKELEDKTADTIRHEEISQDDIDKLFS